MHRQVHHLVHEMAHRRGDSPAVTFKDRTVSYGEAWQEIVAFAGGLVGFGLQRGERVAIYLDKRIEIVSAIFGTSAAGGVFVPVNPLLRPKQVGYILDDCRARVLVTSAERFQLLREQLEESSSLELVIVVGRCERPTASSSFGLLTWDEIQRPFDILPDPDVIDIDMAAILYTSGSTGKPKGVVVSHRNLIVGALTVSEYLENDEHDCILSVLPLSFDAGFSQLTTAFAVGAHIVLVNYLLPIGRGAPLCQAPRHRADLRSASVDAARGAEVAGGGLSESPVLRQHRRSHAQGDARAAPGDLPRPASRTSCMG